ncbi:CCC motif membrane protein [Pedobacter sp. MC2016-05]|uniref:CCC motif membrane protein n=1 Tax=Pedobacter sp. MC2016-05 TaxID=2994474 RepID=UPI00224757AE|nr:CCC motif membrane protein [Pedobacter sp. MC2016-05]MCX2475715.1 CCC motif membrane protein [Pedobacter sp. MC2016-05]
MSEEQQNPPQNNPIDLNKPEQPNTPPSGFGPITPPPFQQPPPFGQFGGMGGQQNLPNATVALVLGILALPACCFYGIFGLIFGIIAWALGGSDVKKYHLNPTMYTESSFKNAKAGKICGMIATILSLLFIIFFVLIIAGAITHPEAYDRFFKGFN